MRRIILFFILLTGLLTLGASTSMAQSAPEAIDINVNLTCGSIDVSLTSRFIRPVKAQVYAGNVGLTEWNLVDRIGEFTRAGANGTGSRTYFFVLQPPNTQISFSVRVYDDVSNTLVDVVDATRDCDGNANNAPPPSSPSNNPSSPATASFLASCNSAGGITVQPVGGVSFTLSATQISQSTAMAIANNQNMTITSASGITALGTPANAVQLIASNGYSLIIPATTCAQIVSVPTTTYNTPISQAAALSCSNIPADAAGTHVVRAGENLFRIGLRYGFHFTLLAAYNGIPDPTRIFVGQCIAIPSSASG